MAKFEIIGHRGNGVGTGENTITAARAAFRAGADRVEIDVQRSSRESRIFIKHGEMLWARGASIGRDPLDPDLGQFMGNIRKPIIIHIKRRWFNPWHDRRVVDYIAKLNVCDRVVLSSFWPSTLTYSNRNHPELKTAFISIWPWYDLFFSKRLNADEYHGWWRTIGPRTIRKAKQRRVKLIGFIVNDQTLTAKLSGLGASGIITDRIKPLVSHQANRRPQGRQFSGPKPDIFTD